MLILVTSVFGKGFVKSILFMLAIIHTETILSHKWLCCPSGNRKESIYGQVHMDRN